MRLIDIQFCASRSNIVCSSSISMPCWYYDKEELRNTPSIQDGIDYETECRYRKEGARFIIDTGTKMDLGYSTTATGVVYFHRFYMFHSFRNFPRYVTACCCLFLAGKVEETPKKCNDIIKTARVLLPDAKFKTFGEDPKEEVITLERILLQTIKFDLQVEHPYSYLLKYAKCLKGDKHKLEKMVQMAWTFVNDSLCTTLSLQWEPEVIAVALMHLSGKLSKFEVVDWSGRTSKHLRWWDMFVEDVSMVLLEDICHQVLDLYSQPHPDSTPDSPPLQPSVQSPSVKKEHVSRPVSPAILHHSPAPAVIPVKVSKTDNKQHIGENVPEKTEPPVPKSNDASYQYSSYTHSTISSNFPPTYATPLAVPAVPPSVVTSHPPVAPSGVSAPSYPSYPPQYTAPLPSQYYTATQVSNRSYYPPGPT